MNTKEMSKKILETVVLFLDECMQESPTKITADASNALQEFIDETY